MMNTLIDEIAEKNGFTWAQACGYVDGQLDRQRGLKPTVPELEMTEYAHGYFRGYKELSREL
jgi:hypothetical protein